MNIDQKAFVQEEPAKCTTCKSFYASEAYKGLCSSCWKKSQTQKNDVQLDSLRKQSIDTQAGDIPNLEQKKEELKQIQPQIKQKIEEVKQTEEPPKQVDRKRCFNCKKKVGLLGIECKCGFVYCNTHRLPEQHSCSFNHKKVANDRLKEALVKVYNGKIAYI